MSAAVQNPSKLSAQWREQAQMMRERGAPDQARLLEHVASELDEALGAGGDDLLTLKQAAAESGYSQDHLGSLVRKGRLENAGSPGAPRVRRSGLPTKDARKPGRPTSDAQKIAADFRKRTREV